MALLVICMAFAPRCRSTRHQALKMPGAERVLSMVQSYSLRHRRLPFLLKHQIKIPDSYNRRLGNNVNIEGRNFNDIPYYYVLI